MIAEQESTAPALVPFLIEIEHQVEATLEGRKIGMSRVVEVDPKMTAGFEDVESGAVQQGVRLEYVGS